MNYNCLSKQIFSLGNYSLVPIRLKDRYKIMRWRNEQMYHLRQDKPLTKDDQDFYFNNIVVKLFEEETPKQILFSLLESNYCIGYGGLVHINWVDRNAEVSFIMDTKLEKERFDEIWAIFLNLIDEIAFKEMNLHKVYTYAFDLRPNIYSLFENSSYLKEARFIEHKLINGNYIDIVIHAKLNPHE